MRFPERQRDREQPYEQIYDQEMPEIAGATYDELLDITVQLSDIIDAVEMTYGDLEYFLDKKTGEIISSKGLILVGEKKAVYIAIKNNKIVERNTRLAERLRKS